ncbi:MAG: DHH family phosphoesterase [Calditrichia bacterium]
MPNDKKQDNSNLMKELAGLDKALAGRKHLLIVVHNNPDPDAIATAAALGFLAEQRSQLKVSIAYGGNIGRAENRAMVKKLKIHMKQINRVRFTKYDRIALVDTQPGAGNNSLPGDVKCHIVIDHHPSRSDLNVEFGVIKPEIGVSATILVEWLKESKLDIPGDLATALSYAINSETQNLGREASSRDIQAYLSVYVKSSMRKLAQITHPKLQRTYFVVLARALNHTNTFRNLICAHLGEVPSAEIVSEIADFLLRYERMGWALCTGRFKNQLIISVRSANRKARAGKLVKHLVPDPNTVGGHDMIAGGFILMQDSDKKSTKDLEEQLMQNFARQLGYKKAEWKPLLASSEII